MPHKRSWVFLALYNADTAFIDNYARENDDFLWVSAAGNYGTQNQFLSILTPCDAKNSICVGASNSYGPDATPEMKGPNYVAAFSSKGSTVDGRIKPDIIAPGRFYFMNYCDMLLILLPQATMFCLRAHNLA